MSRHVPLLLVTAVLFLLVPGAVLRAELDEPPEALLSPTLDGDLDREIALMEDLRRGVLLAVSWIFLVVGLLLMRTRMAQAAEQPLVLINAPTNGAEVWIDRAVPVLVTARSANGVARVELWVNGHLQENRPAPQEGLTTFSTAFAWQPSRPGPYTLIARAFDDEGKRRPRGDELDELHEERLLPVLGVLRLAELAVHMDELPGAQRETSPLDPREDLSGQPPLHRVRLDQDE